MSNSSRTPLKLVSSTAKCGYMHRTSTVAAGRGNEHVCRATIGIDSATSQPSTHGSFSLLVHGLADVCTIYHLAASPSSRTPIMPRQPATEGETSPSSSQLQEDGAEQDAFLCDPITVELCNGEGTITALSIAVHDGQEPIICVGTSTGMVLFISAFGLVLSVAQPFHPDIVSTTGGAGNSGRSTAPQVVFDDSTRVGGIILLTPTSQRQLTPFDGHAITHICVDATTPSLLMNPNTFRTAQLQTRSLVEGGIIFLQDDGTVLTLPKEGFLELCRMNQGLLSAGQPQQEPTTGNGLSVKSFTRPEVYPSVIASDVKLHVVHSLVVAGFSAFWRKLSIIGRLEGVSNSTTLMMNDDMAVIDGSKTTATRGGGSSGGSITKATALCTRLCANDPLDVLIPNVQLDRCFVHVGGKPGIAGHIHRQENAEALTTTAQVVSEVANRALGFMKGWWSGSHSSAAAAAGNVLPGGNAVKVVPRALELLQQTHYTGILSRCVIDPSQRYAACLDANLGRIWILDLISGVLVKVIKGTRGAECEWAIHKPRKNQLDKEDGSVVSQTGAGTLLLAVHLKFRSVVEFYGVNQRDRIAAVAVQEGATLLPADLTDPASAWLWNPDGTLVSFLLHPKGRKVTIVGAGGKRRNVYVDPNSSGGPVTLLDITKELAKAPNLETELVDQLVEVCSTPNDFMAAANAIPQAGGWDTPIAQHICYDKLLAKLKMHFRPNPNDECTMDFSYEVMELSKTTWTAAQVLNFLVLKQSLIAAYYAVKEKEPKQQIKNQSFLALAPPPPSVAPAESGDAGGELVPAAAADNTSLTSYFSFFGAGPAATTTTAGAKPPIPTTNETTAAWIEVLHRSEEIPQEAASHLTIAVATYTPPPATADDGDRPTGNNTATNVPLLKYHSPTSPASPNSSEAESTTPPEAISLPHFLDLFWCGGHKIRFRKQKPSVRAMEELSLLFFEKCGAAALVEQSKYFTKLGMETTTCVELFVHYLVHRFQSPFDLAREIEPRLLMNVLGRISPDALHQLASATGCLYPTTRVSLMCVLLAARLEAQQQGNTSTSSSSKLLQSYAASGTIDTLKRDLLRFVLLDKLFSGAGSDGCVVPIEHRLRSASVVEVVAKTPFYYCKLPQDASCGDGIADQQGPAAPNNVVAALFDELGTTEVGRRCCFCCELAVDVLVRRENGQAYSTEYELAARFEEMLLRIDQLVAIPDIDISPDALAKKAPKRHQQPQYDTFMMKLVSANTLVLATLLEVTTGMLVPLRGAIQECANNTERFTVQRLKAALVAHSGLTGVGSRFALQYLRGCKKLVDACGAHIATRLVVENMLALLPDDDDEEPQAPSDGHSPQQQPSSAGNIASFITQLITTDDHLVFPSISSKVRMALQRVSLLSGGSHNSSTNCSELLLMQVTDVCSIIDLCFAVTAEETVAKSFLTCDGWASLFEASGAMHFLATIPESQPSHTVLTNVDSARRQALFDYLAKELVALAAEKKPASASRATAEASIITTARNMQEALQIIPVDFTNICLFVCQMAVSRENLDEADETLVSIQSRADALQFVAFEVKRRINTFISHFAAEEAEHTGGDKVALAKATARRMSVEALVTPQLAAWLHQWGNTARAALLVDPKLADPIGISVGDSSIIRDALSLPSGEKASPSSSAHQLMEAAVDTTQLLCELLEQSGDKDIVAVAGGGSGGRGLSLGEVGALLGGVCRELRKQLLARD